MYRDYSKPLLKVMLSKAVSFAVFSTLGEASKELYNEHTTEKAFWAGNSDEENQRKVQVAKDLFAAKYGADPPVT